MRIWHLLTHTAGLTYGFHHSHPVDRLYREAGFEWGAPPDLDLAGACDAWAGLPLLFQPGSEWNYSVGDRRARARRRGRLRPVARRVLRRADPRAARMHDTAFALRDGDARAPRRALLAGPARRAARCATTSSGQAAFAPPRVPVRRRRAALDRARLPALHAHAAGRRRARRRAAARAAHDRVHGPQPPARRRRPGARSGGPLFAESAFDGIGFGLGFSVVLDPAAGQGPDARPASWRGEARRARRSTSTRVEDLGVLFLTQLLPSSTHPIRPQLRQLVSQAIVD